MKLYAVVIGKPIKNQRYVCYHPDFSTWKSNQIGPLAVTDDYTKARKMRRQTLESCGHKSVYLITFESIK